MAKMRSERKEALAAIAGELYHKFGYNPTTESWERWKVGKWKPCIAFEVLAKAWEARSVHDSVGLIERMFHLDMIGWTEKQLRELLAWRETNGEPSRQQEDQR